MNVHRGYQVRTEYSGKGYEKSCLVLVIDKYNTVWQDHVISCDEYVSDKAWRNAIAEKVDGYKKEWVDPEKAMEG